MFFEGDRASRPHVAALFALGLAACTGHIGGELPDDGVGVAEGPVCTSLAPGPSPIRRMTRAEYSATVRDLLGDDTDPASAFVIEEEALGFNNQATALGVTELLAEQYMLAAEGIAARATTDLRRLLPCDPGVIGEYLCAKQLIQTLGKKAYRRPLSATEVAQLLKVYSWGEAEHSFRTGIELSIQAMLQSPHFLYRVELGMPDPVEHDVVALSPYEIASRLSYLIWGSMPDDALFAEADAGGLFTREQIAEQARRMLDDPKAREAVANFHTQWLGLSQIETIRKDQAAYPTYDDALRPLWKAETLAFLENVVFDGQGDVQTMLTAPYSFMNGPLAAFYGLAEPPSGDAFVRVELDPKQRAGLLTQASVLAVNAKPDQSSPIHRGKFVRERLLCQQLPPPPNNIKIEAPEVDPTATTRERFAEHAVNPECAACHTRMDPIGFGFEHYDGVGLWRDGEYGMPIDATGELNLTRDIDGPFDGAIELGERLASSEEVRQCVATQWFRFGYGRAEAEEDACNLEQIQTAFAASGYNVKELLIALTQTDAFRFRHAEAGEDTSRGMSPTSGSTALGGKERVLP